AELAFAAAAESQSEHPIAHGIVAEAKNRGISWSRAREVRNITGEGIVANVDGQDTRILTPGHLARPRKEISDPRLKQLESQGKTVVVLVRGGAPRALFALADIVRPESKQAIAELKSLGIESIMLTGDALGVAQAVSEELGISE